MKTLILAAALLLVNQSALIGGTPNLTFAKLPDGTGPIVVEITDEGDIKYEIGIGNPSSYDVRDRFVTYVYLDGNRKAKFYRDGLRSKRATRLSGDLSDLSAGGHTLKVVIDYRDDVSESRESDNEMTFKFTYEDDDAFAWPLPSKYRTISQGFGVTWSANSAKLHTGIDIVAPKGTLVSAVADGKVTRIGSLGSSPEGVSSGSYIIVNNGSFDFCYLHLRYLAVKEGDRVTKGKKLAEVVQDHLHFGLRKSPTTSSISPRGALPKKDGTAGSDPKFPERFVAPLDYLE